MKRLLLIFTLLISSSLFAQVEKVIPKRPSPPKLVNDLSNSLSAAQREELERKLVAYDDSTSTQIAVVLVKSLEGYSVEDYALALGREWGVGGKQNNGIVLLAAMEDRKIRIEVGYGLEGAIPDLTSKAIIDNDITPNFKEGNYYRGLNKAVDDIILAAAGRYKAPDGYTNRKGKSFKWGTLLIILIFIIIALSGGGGGNGTYVSRGGTRRVGGFPWWMFLGGGGGGFGGGGSGSGGGGGFGGFGGGSFGGGGSSGSW